MKLTEVYTGLPAPAQVTVQQIIQECRKSKASAGFVLAVAQKKVIVTLAKCNPGNELIQSSVVSGVPVDLRSLDLDWDTTFDLLSAERAGLLSRILYPLLQPIMGFVIGIKIPDELINNREQRLVFGKWLAIASVLYFSEIANKDEKVGKQR